MSAEERLGKAGGCWKDEALGSRAVPEDLALCTDDRDERSGN